MDSVKTLIEFIIHSVFGEAFSVFFLLGGVMTLVGLALLILFAFSRFLGYRTVGTVAGAVQRTRIKRKEQDGKTIEKKKKTLMPVYEYQASDGSIRQMQGSEGGSMTKDYVTGQAVNLIVREDDGYDDVYDADRYGALYLGLGFLVVGMILMVWIGSVASALGMGILGMLFVIVLNGLAALLIKTQNRHNPEARKPYTKEFDPADLRPVEHFIAV